MPEKNPITNTIRQVCFMVVSVALVFGTFYYENRDFSAQDSVLHAFSAIDYKAPNEIPNNGIIRFNQASQIKQDVSLKSGGYADGYIFDVKSGEFWGDFSFSDAKTDFIVGNVVVIPYSASFNLQFDGDKFSLAVYKGDVYLGFLDKDINVVKYEDPYSGVFMNKFLVPLGNRVDFNISRIDEKFKTLLPSKVAKEVKLRLMSINTKDSSYAKNFTDYVKQNLRDDRRIRASLGSTYKTEIVDNGLSVDEGLLGKTVGALEDTFTFIPAKKAERNSGKLFGYFSDAMFYAAKGDMENGTISLNKFGEGSASIPAGDYMSKLILMRDEPNFAGILDLILEKKLTEKGNEFYALDGFWNDVYEAIDAGDSSSLEALTLYYQKLLTTVDKIADKEILKGYLAYQNQLLNNLFDRYPTFYKDGYFESKEKLEQKFLSLFESGQMKDELMLSLIKDKMDVLVRLKNYFFDRKIEINEARKIVSRLKDSIQDLMTKSSSDLAVLQIFEKNLKGIGSFWGFLNTPEYYASTSYGFDYAERYTFYLKERSQIWNFIEVGSGETGGIDTAGGSTKSIFDIKNRVTAAFTANSDVENFEIGEIKDVSQTDVSVKLIVKGYPVEAAYDINQGTLKNVYIYGELLTANGVKLKGLSSLIDKKFAEFKQDNTADDTGTQNVQETNAQIILKRYLANKMTQAGFIATADNIKIVDEFQTVYRVEGVHLDGEKTVEITFDFVAKTEKATKVYLILGADVTELNGEYSLSDIKAEVEKLAPVLPKSKK